MSDDVTDGFQTYEDAVQGKRLTIPTYSSAGFFGGVWG
jgi:hypothetical protein